MEARRSAVGCGAGIMTAGQAIRICEACDRFEWEWLNGATPRIESYLDDVPTDDRPRLLEDLLRIEMEWRRDAGDRPAPAEYIGRFPDDAGLIERILREWKEEGDEEPPPRVGPYELIEEIGRGGEGVVYRALKLGIVPHEVAIKLMSARSVGSRDSALRFLREVRNLADIEHDNIVPYLDSGDERGQLYYVMRLMRGGSLAERPGPLDPMEAASLIIQIAEAIDHLHSQPRPIVHRDLKPKNILLDERGRPHVADFGLAVLLDGDEIAVGACGTIPYIAPEQFDRRFGEVGPACDLYSLGVILYELLTGQPPFPRTHESILDTLEREPIPPSRLRAGIPEALERICLKCLRKSTRDRYGSARQLLEDLRCFERGQPLVHARPEGFRRRLVDWARREPALAIRLAVIVACSSIIWGTRIATGSFAPLLPEHPANRIEWPERLGHYVSIEAILVWANQVILIAWGLASWAFQLQLNRRRDQGGLQFGWRLVDVTTLALLIELDDALMSPLTVAFAVLIVASAFWARADQILQTTLLSMAGYALLALTYRHFHPESDRPWRHFHYIVGLAAIGMMLTYQANRIRALARICGDRD